MKRCFLHLSVNLLLLLAAWSAAITGTAQAPPAASPWYSQVTPLGACSDTTLDPYTSCQCPYGEIPADNGCCKKRCPTRCSFEHANLLRQAPTQPAMDSCDDVRICTYMWGDPHAKYHDYRFDPQWYGWMLLTQCDGLKIFARARGLAQRRKGITTIERVLIRFRTTLVMVEHDFVSNPARMLVKGVDATQAGVTSLRSIPLPAAESSVTIGSEATEVTITRLTDNKIQICTGQGDTIKITRNRNIELNVQMCLAPTCNLRATGFMGILGAPLNQRFPLPGLLDSEGKRPDNGSLYHWEYMSAWYNETDRQLGGIYSPNHPAFPYTNSERCLSRSTFEIAAGAGNGGGFRRYRVFKNTAGNFGQSQANTLCEEKGGYLATIRNKTDYDQFMVDLSAGYESWGNAMMGGSDAETEGSFVWKYGPPYNRGGAISRGVGRDHQCLQDFCNWAGGEPNDYQSIGGEDMLIVKESFEWNDLPDGDEQRARASRYVCEFVRGDFSFTRTASRTQFTAEEKEQGQVQNPENQNSVLLEAIEDDILSITTGDEIGELRRSPVTGPDCEATKTECLELGCPEEIYTQNDDPQVACGFAVDWIAAQAFNEENPGNPIKNENLATTETQKTQQENTNECQGSQHYCDSCGANGTPSCFECTSTTCPEGQEVFANSETGSCTCRVPSPAEPECRNNDDCQSNPLTTTVPACGLVVCSDSKCVVGVKAAGAICRRAAVACDIVESCDGTSSECPPDQANVRTSTGSCEPVVDSNDGDDDQDVNIGDGSPAARGGNDAQEAVAESQFPWWIIVVCGCLMSIGGLVGFAVYRYKLKKDRQEMEVKELEMEVEEEAAAEEEDSGESRNPSVPNPLGSGATSINLGNLSPQETSIFGDTLTDPKKSMKGRPKSKQVSSKPFKL